MKDATFSSAHLLALYDRISDAEDAIPRLRRFVLDLAVRGKLVEQDSGDEPASDLLKRIAAERKRRFEVGELKKSKGLPAPKAADHLFRVPRTWVWTVADHVWDFENGDRGKNYPSRDQLVERGVPFVNAGHLVDGRVNMSEMNYVTPEKFRQIGGGKLKKGDQIYCLRGSLGKHAVFDLDSDAAIASSLVILRPVVPDCVPYLSLFLDSDIAVVLLRRFDNGSAQPNLSSANLRKYDVPLPPLAEQHRIVAKVDELMALCDQLEQARAGREAVRDRLTTASLARLTAPDTDADTFQSHARFALQSLPTLTTRSDQIKTLRQTILNLAVRGKLVAQDAADEPAEELLKRIRQEKAKLGIKLRPEIADVTDLPFELPQGWVLSSIGEVCSKTGSGSTPRGGKEVYTDNGIPFLRSQNIYNDGLRLDDVALISAEIHERMSGTAVKPADLLLNITGGSMGRCCRVMDDFDEANVSQHVAIIRPAIGGMSDFLHRLVLSPYFQAFIFGEQTGAGRGGLPKNRMDRIAVALPPLAEQHRIVAKVDALMALCDRLEVSLTTTDTTRQRLLTALLHEALAPDAETMKAAE